MQQRLHKVLLKEPYEVNAITSDGQPTRRPIAIGAYKTQPNNVRTSTGEIYHYTSPEQVKPAMSDLIDWYRRTENEDEHPIIIAATFHYRFVRIHPFDDGNGRMARLLMNMILIKHGYTVAIIPIEEREQYIKTLEQVDRLRIWPRLSPRAIASKVPSGQYFSQIGVIPSGLEPFGLDADLGRLLLLEQTHGNLSQEGPIFRGMAGAYP